MRRCPKCKRWELDVTPERDTIPDDKSYFFRCWNCGFECSREKAEKENYPSEAMLITLLKGGKKEKWK